MRDSRLARAAAVAMTVASTLLPSAPVTADPVTRVNGGTPEHPLLQSLTRLDDRTPLLHEGLEQQDDGPLTVRWNTTAGDLDGDGAPEIAHHHWVLTADPIAFGYSGTLTLTVISGRTGEVLWTRDSSFQGGYPYPVVNIRTGPDGTPGLLLFIVDNMSPTSPAYRLTMTALAGNGDTAWEHLFQTTSTYFTGGTVTTGAPFSISLLDALRGDATDVLIGSSSWVNAEATAVARTEISIIDGRDGAVVSRPETELAEWIPFANSVGDVDSDGADDFVFFGDGHVTAYSGREPKTIWRRESAGIVPYLWADPMGDLTGDGVVDLVQSREEKDTYDVLDGATGERLWGFEGMFPYPLGDIDRDGRTEIGVKSGFLIDGFGGERFTGYRSDGRRLYQETYGVDLDDCGGFCLIANSLLPAGDLQGDGVRDTFVMRRRFSDGERMDETRYLVDGRNGHVVYTDERYVPLLTSVDGRGDDFANVRLRAGDVWVRTFDARDGAPLWRAHLRVTGAKKLANWLDPYAAGVDLDADGCGDMLVTLSGGRGAVMVGLSGRNGSVLWTRSLSGDMTLDDASRSGRTLRC